MEAGGALKAATLAHWGSRGRVWVPKRTRDKLTFEHFFCMFSYFFRLFGVTSEFLTTEAALPAVTIRKGVPGLRESTLEEMLYVSKT